MLEKAKEFFGNEKVKKVTTIIGSMLAGAAVLAAGAIIIDLATAENEPAMLEGVATDPAIELPAEVE